MTFFSEEMLKAIQNATRSDEEERDSWYRWLRREEDANLSSEEAAEDAAANQDENERTEGTEEADFRRQEAEAAADVTSIREPEPEEVAEPQYGYSQPANEPVMA